jgi:hypothetical protein
VDWLGTSVWDGVAGCARFVDTPDGCLASVGGHIPREGLLRALQPAALSPAVGAIPFTCAVPAVIVPLGVG